MTDFNFKENIGLFNNKTDLSMSLTADASHQQGWVQKIGLTMAGIGILILVLALFNIGTQNPTLPLASSLILIFVGTIIYAYKNYSDRPEGIKNTGNMFASMTSRGAVGWVAAIVITGFYVLLYWYPEFLGLGQGANGTNGGLVRLFDPLSQFFKGMPASQWFVYGTLYTLAILVMGFKFIWKYRHNTYQTVRTISVMFFQTGFAFLIPEILEGLYSDTATNWFDKDMKNMWPLDYDFFYSWHLDNMLVGGSLGLTMLAIGLLMIFVISPILTFYYGKRWYCSWVCGCGGLAETAGDPFRHLSDKSLTAWKIERWVIYSVLVFVTVMTVAVIFSVLHDNPQKYAVSKPIFIGILAVLFAGLGAFAWRNKAFQKETNKTLRIALTVIAVLIVGLAVLAMFTGSRNVFFVDPYGGLQKWYGFLIGAAFSGVVGVGFYPLMGSRVWCRFGCPMAALLGLQQKFFSRFRITTNGEQCISCGNCSTYCEMGIDVRWYAQRGQDIVRSSCVGCGVCSAVCPRGVLRLENGPVEDRKAIHIRRDAVDILDPETFG